MSGEMPSSNGSHSHVNGSPATNGNSLDASLMLEAALQQMDGIIAGKM